MKKQLKEAIKAGVRVRDIKLNGGRLIQLTIPGKAGVSYVYFNERDSLSTIKFKIETLQAYIRINISNIKNA